MRNILFPFCISVILFLIFQLIDISDFHEKSYVREKKNVSNNDVVEINRYFKNFNNHSLLNSPPDKLPITEAMTGSNKVYLVDAGDYAQWITIGKGLDSTNLIKDSNIVALIRYKKRPTDKIGYIHLKNLSWGSYRYFMESMEHCAGKDGFDTLYLDLRDCPNGVDAEAIKIANQLVYNSGIVLMKEMFFNGTVNTITSRGKVFFPLKKINILINSHTSGVPEMLIKMLDNGSEISIMGQKTKGDNLIKRFFPLSSGNYAFIPIGYYCEDCKTHDVHYDQAQLHPILPSKMWKDEQLDSIINSKFRPISL